MAAKGVTLEDIIEGRRCTPLTHQEFQLFLKHAAHSLENLQFHHWYTDYRRRFFALPQHEQLRSPPPLGFNSRRLPLPASRAVTRPSSIRSWFSGSDPASGMSTPTISQPMALGTFPLAQQQAASMATAVEAGAGDSNPWRRRGSKQVDAVEDSDLDGGVPVINITLPETVNKRDSSDFLSMTASTDAPVPGPLPFAAEVSRVVATFLSADGASELNIDAALRQAVLAQLALDRHGRPTGTTHPDIFANIERSCWAMMRDHSLPDFLRFASGNINQGKEYFWYAVGVCDLAIGLLIGLVCLFFVHSRWARLGSLPFLCFGSMQVFSASRHFCTQVYGRDARQLYPWELADPNVRPASPISKRDSMDSGELEKNIDTPPVSASSIAPWDDLSSMATLPKRAPLDMMPKQVQAPLLGVSVPIFGPETAVKDPYIAGVQKRLITVILASGAIGMIFFGVILLAIPQQM